MPNAKPAPQCNVIFPTGRRCGSPALRQQAYCYHHIGKQQEFARDRLAFRQLERLAEKLNAMNVSELLLALHQKLTTLPKTLSRFPEIAFTLTYALDRLHEISTLESVLCQIPQQNQEFAAAHAPQANAFNNLENPRLESGI